jgi:hypothetical protein
MGLISNDDLGLEKPDNPPSASKGAVRHLSGMLENARLIAVPPANGKGRAY